MVTDLRSPDEPGSVPDSVSSLRPADGALFVSDRECADARICIGQHTMRRQISWLLERAPIVNDITEFHAPREAEIDAMLRQVNINHHDFRHQRDVTAGALSIAEIIGISEEMREAIGVGSMFHDMGYRRPKGLSDAEIQKKDFNNHARIGRHMFQALYSNPLFAEYFDGWSQLQREAAELGIYYHNGSNREFHDNRSRIPVASELVRASDKALDNVVHRVDLSRITPGIKEIEPKTYGHRLVPASIEGIDLQIDLANKHVELVHYADRSVVEKRYGEYSVEALVADFQHTYGKAIVSFLEVMERAMAASATYDAKPLTSAVLLEDSREGTMEISNTISYQNGRHLRVVG